MGFDTNTIPVRTFIIDWLLGCFPWAFLRKALNIASRPYQTVMLHYSSTSEKAACVALTYVQPTTPQHIQSHNK